MDSSKFAIKKAMENEEHGRRLLEIAREHIQLVKEASFDRHEVQYLVRLNPNEEDDEYSLSIIRRRICQLKDERDAILQLYMSNGELGASISVQLTDKDDFLIKQEKAAPVLSNSK